MQKRCEGELIETAEQVPWPGYSNTPKISCRSLSDKPASVGCPGVFDGGIDLVSIEAFRELPLRGSLCFFDSRLKDRERLLIDIG